MPRRSKEQSPTDTKKLESKEGGEPGEYSYEKGIAEILRRVEEKMAQQQYVVVAFYGAGLDVGKTTLSSRLESELVKLKIPTWDFQTFDSLSRDWVYGFQGSQRSVELSRGGKGKGFGRGVLIFSNAQVHGMEHSDEEQRTIRAGLNDELKEQAKKLSLKLSVDIWVALYTPASRPPVPAVLMCDIVICNEHAVEKPKSGQGEKKKR